MRMPNPATGARIKVIRNRLELTLDGLGKKFGLSRQAVHKWEAGASDPSMEVLGYLAEHGGVTVEWILTGKAGVGGGRNAEPFVGGGRAVPKSGTTEMVLERTGEELGSTGMVQTYFPCSAAAFALQVVGDSMAPDFLDGDVIVVDPIEVPVPGDFVWVEMADGDSLFRRYRPLVGKKHRMFDLVPCNPNWPTVRVDGENPGEVRGKIIERATSLSKPRNAPRN